MSKFLAITIAAVLILSLFLTVFALGDGSEREDADVTTAASDSASAVTTAATTAALPDSGIDANIFIDATGHHGYSIVDGIAFFFVKLDYADYSGTPASVYFDGQDLEELGYECNVRVSDDAAVWTMPRFPETPASGYTYCSSLTHSSIYVSYTMLAVENEAEAKEHYQKIFDSAFSSEEVFKVYLSDRVGDPLITGAN